MKDSYKKSIEEWQARYLEFRNLIYKLEAHGGDTFAMFNYISEFMDGGDRLLMEIDTILRSALEEGAL